MAEEESKETRENLPVDQLERRSRSWRELLPTRSSNIQDGRYDHFLTEQIEQYPRGYPRLSAYVNTDIDGRLYRRFGHVRNRLLLHLQDEICALEEKLERLDNEEASGESDQVYRLCSRRYDEEDLEDCKRKVILNELGARLKEYDDLLLREHTIMSIRQPSRKVHRSYFDYIWNEKPVCKEEYQFIYRRDDFLALGVQEDGWLGSWTETLARLLPNKVLQYILTSREDRQRISDETGVQFYSNERTEKFIKAFVGAAATSLLLVPIAVLYALTLHNATWGLKLGVLSIFVVAFALALGALTRASRHEMFGASAAYCAVLVVFLGNIPQSPTK